MKAHIDNLTIFDFTYCVSIVIGPIKSGGLGLTLRRMCFPHCRSNTGNRPHSCVFHKALA